MTLHRDHAGEWDFDLAWKPLESFPVRFGWLRAIRAGHARVQAGLDIRCPVLVLSSDRTTFTTALDERRPRTSSSTSNRSAAGRGSLGSQGSPRSPYPGAVHDVVLSRPQAPRAGLRRDRALADVLRALVSRPWTLC